MIKVAKEIFDRALVAIIHELIQTNLANPTPLKKNYPLLTVRSSNFL
jgi:hypothetical protein